MKKIAMILMITTSMICSAQVDGNQKFQVEGRDKSQIIYITGTTKVAQYSIVTRTVDASSLNLSDKAPAPILQVYIASKKFIGGTLTDEKGKKTTITELKIETTPAGKENIFTVVGKNFSRGFKLVDGFILFDDKDEVVFYTDKVGIWKVKQK